MRVDIHERRKKVEILGVKGMHKDYLFIYLSIDRSIGEFGKTRSRECYNGVFLEKDDGWMSIGTWTRLEWNDEWAMVKRIVAGIERVDIYLVVENKGGKEYSHKKKEEEEEEWGGPQDVRVKRKDGRKRKEMDVTKDSSSSSSSSSSSFLPFSFIGVCVRRPSITSILLGSIQVGGVCVVFKSSVV